jgi:hypothetical protein
LEALGNLEIYLATLPKVHPASTLVKPCPCDWFSRAVAVLGTVVVPSGDRHLLGNATAPTWQRFLASSCRRLGRGRGIRFESLATGWVINTIAKGHKGTAEGGLSQVLRIVFPRISNLDSASIARGSLLGAIALVSGRRMAEVHLSGEFDVIDDYQLSFKGQLKGKAKKVKISADDGSKRDVMLRDFEFTIPSLVRADLIVKGIEWLDAKGKRFSKDEPQERVNARWSKVLSERVRDEWCLFEGMTYHKFRGAYFAACVRNAELEGSVKSVDYERYAFQILGDNDSETVGRYKRFDVKPDSITRI